MTHSGYWTGKWDLTWAAMQPHGSSEDFSCRLFLVFSIFSDLKSESIYFLHEGLNASGTYFRKSNIWGGRVVLSLFSSGDAHVVWKPFPSFGGRCFPFNMEQRGWSVREGGGRKKLLVCVAMPYCSSHGSTVVNYGEIWETWEKHSWWHDRAAGQISQIRKTDRYEGMGWRPQSTL